jgi:tRNA dimethylallyltransferase
VKPLRTILLAGPTAVGKSAVALNLAERLGGEIISVDSMQVYRGLDLGTAKPTAAEREAVPHHLIDVADLTQAFDAAQFVRLAQAAAEEILRRQRAPILCGGTGLYFKAFLEGLGEAPPSNLELRSQLEKTSLPELLSELQERDPATFAEIDRQNPRRVVRALEVIRITGKPFHEQRAGWKRLPSNFRLIEQQKGFFFSVWNGVAKICNDVSTNVWSRCLLSAWWLKRSAC